MATSLNPNIILSGTPAPPATPLATPQQQLDTLSRLRQYQQQQQLAPLQQQKLQTEINTANTANQESTLDLQRKQIQAKDTALLTEGYKKYGSDFSKLADWAQTNGVSPDAVIGIQDRASKQQKDAEAASTASRARTQAALTSIGDSVGTLKDTPLDQRSAVAAEIIAKHTANGDFAALPPESSAHFAHIFSTQQGATPPAPLGTPPTPPIAQGAPPATIPTAVAPAPPQGLVPPGLSAPQPGLAPAQSAPTNYGPNLPTPQGTPTQIGASQGTSVPATPNPAPQPSSATIPPLTDDTLDALDRSLNGSRAVYQRAAEATGRAEAARQLDLKKLKDMNSEAAEAFLGADPNDKQDLVDRAKKFAAKDADHANYAKFYLNRVAVNQAGLDVIAKRALTDEQRQTAKEKADELARNVNKDTEESRHNKAEEATNALKASIDAKKFAAEFGGDAVKGWAASIKDNPDAAASVPAALRTSVQQQFTKDTGLPFPKPLAGGAVDQERAARNAMSAIKEINEDLQDPEIQKRVGTILGRLGNAEQTVGGAVGLTPDQEAKAQRLRTNMRYMVFQEGKALLGGRLPQKLMDELQSSSPNTKMDAGTLRGAMSGVQDGALRALDTADQQRFGGKMRTRDDRGITPVQIGTPKLTYTQAQVDAAVKAHPGLTPQQAEDGFKSAGASKQ